MSIRFRSIQLQGFLSFGESAHAVQLRSLNVIIGPNGSGKSNLLEAFEVLRHAPTDIQAPFRQGGGIDAWIWKGSEDLGSASFDVVASGLNGHTTVRHAFRIGELIDGTGMRVLTEDISSSDDGEAPGVTLFKRGAMPALPIKTNGNWTTTQNVQLRVGGETRTVEAKDISFTQSILSQRRDPELYPEITALADGYASIRLYRDWRFGRDAPARRPQDAAMPNRWLESDGSNLGLILNRFQRNPPAKKRLLSALRKLYNGIEDFGVLIEGGTVQVFLQEGERTIPAARLSDGTLRFLCLLVVLCDPEPPPVVCIEEPELGLHPDILPTVAELLIDAAERCQLIVTTHSDILVDCMHDTPENILIAEKDAHGTQLRRLDADELKPWLDQYRLGELWTRGDIGGTRW